MPHDHRELGTQEFLRTQHPELTNRLDAHDLRLLRAVYAARDRPHQRKTYMLAGAVGQPRDLTAAQLERLEQEGWLCRWNGWGIGPSVARTLGSLLWTCTVCSCTEEHACPTGCWWVREDLCSRCAAVEDPPTLTTNGGPHA